jgi:Flp pilus assembly protein TadB
MRGRAAHYPGGTVAPPKSKRRSRKRRKPGAPLRPSASQRREARAEREVVTEREQRRRDSMLGTYGERPESPFGGLPVSELAIFAGAVGVLVGLVSAAVPALVVGIVVCTLGVVEVTAREHFSGYRSHATLLAGVPAVAIGIALIALIGGSLTRAPLLIVVVPLFGVFFWLLRKRFRTARQARIVRPPAP